MPENGPTRLYKSLTNHEVNIQKIKERLRKNEIIRRIFISIAKLEPCFAREIKNDTGITHKEFYNNIDSIKYLGIVGRIAVRDVDIKNPKNWLERDGLKKFNEWTTYMFPGQKQQYYSNSGFYYITKKGDEKEIIDFICKLENIKESNEKITIYDKNKCCICGETKNLKMPFKKNKNFKICEQCLKSISIEDLNKKLKE